MLTLKAKSIYNDFVGIKVADFILTITLYIDKCLSLTTAIVSDRFSFAEENIMKKEKKVYTCIDISNGTIYVFDKKSEYKRFLKKGKLPKNWGKSESEDK